MLMSRHANINTSHCEHDATLDALERAETEHAADLIWIGVRPVFDPLRPLPRFAALCERLGLRVDAT